MTHNASTFALLFGLAVSAAANAADLSAEQQEIWDIIVACHDGWSDAMQHKDYELFASACPQEPGAQFWYTGQATPVRYGGPDGMWQRIAPQVRSTTWDQLEPVDVQIFEDVALAYFSVVWTAEAMDGEVSSNTTRRVTVLRRSADGWQLVGGSAAAVP